MIPCVDDLTTEPVIGRYYMVRCFQAAERPQFWFPLLGPEHEDKEIIGLPDQHFHFDMRFATAKVVSYWRNLGFRQEPEIAVRHNMIRVQISHTKGVFAYRRMKCLRRMPDFPLFVQRHGILTENSIQPKLEAAYRGTKMTCATCPHRGFKLHQLPQKNGVVVCPGHGLAWNMQTGEMVSRL